jgi:hypothetical protein
MTVKDLIEQLSKFDPETEVVGTFVDPTDYTNKSDIKGIYLGSPFDSNGYSSIDGSEDDFDTLYDDEGEYIGEKVLLIDFGDV